MRVWPSDDTVAGDAREYRIESDTCEALNVAGVGFAEITIKEVVTGIGSGSVGAAMTIQRCARETKASNSIVKGLLV